MGTKILRLFLLVLFFLSMTLLAQEAIEESKAKQLSISGNKTFSNVTLLNFLGLDFSKRKIVKEKIKVTEPECLDITDNLFSFYRKEGFFDVSIEKNESEEAFEIAVNEGFPYTVLSIEFIYNSDSEVVQQDILKAKESIKLKEGERFRVDDYLNAKVILEETLGNDGFPFVNVSETAEVDSIKKSVRVIYKIDEGKRARFGKTNFQGIIHSEEKILRRFIKYDEGEYFSSSKVNETKDALYKSGLFDVVTIKVKKIDENGNVPLNIILKEGRHRKIKVSIGYGSDEKFRFQTQFETLRLFDRYLNAGVTLKRSSLEEIYEVHLLFPYRYNDFTPYIKAKRQTLHWVQTDFTTTILTAGVQKDFGTYEMTLDANFEKINKIEFTYPSPQIKDSALTPDTISLKFNLVRNKSDSLLDPHKGSISSLYLESSRVSNGTLFSKGTLDLRKYIPIKAEKVLAFKLRVSSLITRDSLSEIPYPYRFFTGGQMRLRGYRFSSISPLSQDGALNGGKGSCEGSIEYRFPFRDNFKGLLFFDSGRVTKTNNPFSRGEPFKSDAGFGLRYLTPVGPVGMDVAFKLNKAEYSHSNFQIALFIGYSF